MATCNTIYIDTDALAGDLIKTAVEAMEAVEFNALEKLAKEIFTGSESRKVWRMEALQALREVERVVAYDYVSMVFGADLDSMSGDLLNRVTVALYGNQASGHIRSKPGGDVYGKAMDGKHLSNAVSNYDIPQFDHPQQYNGEKMLDNVMKLTKTMFGDAIAMVWKSFDFSQYVHVV